MLFLANSLFSAEKQDGKEIVPKGATAEKVAGGCKFTEGPAADADDNLFFTDSPRNLVLVLRPGGKQEVWDKDSKDANGMRFDARGRLVACCGEGGAHAAPMARTSFTAPWRVLGEDSEGYRVLWYHSSQKAEQDRQQRQQRLERTYARLEELQAPGRRRPWRTAAEARTAAQRIVAEEKVEGLVRISIDREVSVHYRQVGPGRPGPNTEYRRVETSHYQIRFAEDGEAVQRAARCDGLFPLMTNDKTLSVAEALGKYKYQPFVEKRHEQLKSVFGVMPVWLKNVGRVESLLWLYFVVELVQALLEREVRRQMAARGLASLALYPEGRPATAPTAAVVLGILEGHRRHRLLDEQGRLPASTTSCPRPRSRYSVCWGLTVFLMGLLDPLRSRIIHWKCPEPFRECRLITSSCFSSWR